MCCCFNPNALSKTWARNFWMLLCFSALEWMAVSGTRGYWKVTWNLCPKLLLVFWCELGSFTACLFIHICTWSREISQLLTNTLAIILKVWKDDSMFFYNLKYFSILVENVFHNVNIFWWNTLLIFYTSIFFLLQSATWTIYNLCWLEIAYFLVLREFSHYQSIAFIALYSTNIFTNIYTIGINNQ